MMQGHLPMTFSIQLAGLVRIGSEEPLFSAKYLNHHAHEDRRGVCV
jgi:hypothetical protein